MEVIRCRGYKFYIKECKYMYYYIILRLRTNSVAHNIANLISLNNKLSIVIQGIMILNYIFTVCLH